MDILCRYLKLISNQYYKFSKYHQSRRNNDYQSKTYKFLNLKKFYLGMLSNYLENLIQINFCKLSKMYLYKQSSQCLYIISNCHLNSKFHSSTIHKYESLHSTRNQIYKQCQMYQYNQYSQCLGIASKYHSNRKFQQGTIHKYGSLNSLNNQIYTLSMMYLCRQSSQYLYIINNCHLNSKFHLSIVHRYELLYSTHNQNCKLCMMLLYRQSSQDLCIKHKFHSNPIHNLQHKKHNYLKINNLSNELKDKDNRHHLKSINLRSKTCR